MSVRNELWSSRSSASQAVKSLTGVPAVLHFLIGFDFSSVFLFFFFFDDFTELDSFDFFFCFFADLDRTIVDFFVFCSVVTFTEAC